MDENIQIKVSLVFIDSVLFRCSLNEKTCDFLCIKTIKSFIYENYVAYCFAFSFDCLIAHLNSSVRLCSLIAQHLNEKEDMWEHRQLFYTRRRAMKRVKVAGNAHVSLVVGACLSCRCFSLIFFVILCVVCLLLFLIWNNFR